MTSMKSYSKDIIMLVKENAKRLWILPSLFSLFFLLAEFMPLLMAGSSGRNYMYTNYSSYMSPQSVIYALGAVVIVVASLFHFTTTDKTITFYHSLPFTRKKIFWAQVASGGVFLALPILLRGLLLGILLGVQAHVPGFTGLSILKVILDNLIMTSLFYALSVMTISLTKQLMTYASLAFIIPFIFPISGLIANAYTRTFYRGFNYSIVAFDWLNDINPIKTYFVGDQVSLLAIFMALLITPLALYLGSLLYRIAPSEAAGKGLAFGQLEKFYKLFLGFLGMTFLGLTTINVARDEFTSFMTFLVFGLSALIVLIAIEIIFQRSFTIKRSFPSILIMTLLCLGIVMAVDYDVLGIESYVPDQDEIKTALLLDNFYGDPVISDTLTDIITKEYIEEVRLVHKELLESSPSNGYQTSLVIAYQLKNGKEVRRSYDLSMDQLEGTRAGALLNSKEQQLLSSPLLYVPQSDLKEIYISSPFGKDAIMISSQDKRAFQQVLLSDIASKDVNYTATRVLEVGFEIGHQSLRYSYSSHRMQNIYGSYQQTITWLKEHGYWTSVFGQEPIIRRIALYQGNELPQNYMDIAFTDARFDQVNKLPPLEELLSHFTEDYDQQVRNQNAIVIELANGRLMSGRIELPYLQQLLP